MNRWLERLRELGVGLRPLLNYTRLSHRRELLVLTFALGWGGWAAAGAYPLPGTLLLLWVTQAAVLAAGALFNDWAESRMLKVAPGSYIALHELSRSLAWRLLGGAALLALGLAFAAGWRTGVWAALGLMLAAGYPTLKRHFVMIQAYLGALGALGIPAAYGLYGRWPDQPGWLLYCAALLWLTAVAVHYAIPKREYEVLVGFRSATELLGEYTAQLVVILMLLALFTVLLYAGKVGADLPMLLGLLYAVLVVARQAVFMLRGGEAGVQRAYALHWHFGAGVFAALVMQSF